MIHSGTPAFPERRHSKASFAPHRGRQIPSSANWHTCRSLRAELSLYRSASIQESSLRDGKWDCRSTQQSRFGFSDDQNVRFGDQPLKMLRMMFWKSSRSQSKLNRRSQMVWL